MRPISHIATFFLMLLLSATTMFAQTNPYGDTQTNDKSNRNSSRNHRHCTEAYSSKSFNRDYAGLANSNMYHLDKELRSYIKYRCVTSEQVRRLALLYQTDREKYDFLTHALNFVFDIENLAMAGSVLANRNARDGFYRFLVQQGIPAGDYYNNNTYYAGGGAYYQPPVYTQAPPPNPTYDNSYNNYPDPRLNNPNQTPQYNNQNNNQNPQNNNPNQTPQYNNQNGNQNPQNNNPNQTPQYNNQNGNQNPQNNNQNQTPQYNNQNNNPSQPYVQVNSKAVNSGYQGLMTYKEFAIMKEQIKKNTLEAGRLETAKMMTKENVLTAIQVAEIARLFNFDNNRLDFAKFAFDYTHNRDDYNVVGDVFVFQKNKEDLQRYVQTKK